jgi:hypothetical protein
MQQQLATAEVMQDEIDENIVDNYGLTLGGMTVTVQVSAKIGGPIAEWNHEKHRTIPLSIDARSGTIQIPDEHSWHGIVSSSQAKKHRNLVRAFTLTMMVPESSTQYQLLTQRGPENDYRELNYAVEKGMRIYKLRDIMVLCTARSPEQQSFLNAPPLLVYTVGKGQDASVTNRVDILNLEQNGFMDVRRRNLPHHPESQDGG